MHGVPVVGARTGGIPGLVTDGGSGLLYDPFSARALGEALQRLIDDPALLRRLSSSAPRVKSIAEDAREWDARYATVVGPAAPADVVIV